MIANIWLVNTLLGGLELILILELEDVLLNRVLLTNWMRLMLSLFVYELSFVMINKLVWFRVFSFELRLKVFFIRLRFEVNPVLLILSVELVLSSYSLVLLLVLYFLLILTLRLIIVLYFFFLFLIIIKCKDILIFLQLCLSV